MGGQGGCDSKITSQPQYFRVSQFLPVFSSFLSNLVLFVARASPQILTKTQGSLIDFWVWGHISYNSGGISYEIGSRTELKNHDDVKNI